jgi:hypothetical protein
MTALRVIYSSVAALAFAATLFGLCATGAAASHGVISPGFQSLSRTDLRDGPDVKPKGTVAYDSIQWYPPGTERTVSSAAYSEGYDCCGVNAFGDGVQIVNPGGRLKDVGVVFSVWACQSGNWYDGSCSTARGATFQLPITITVYAACAASSPSCTPVPYAPPGGPILSQLTATKTFKYRPSASSHCNIPSQTLGGFIDPVTKYCTWGLAEVETFNMSLPKVLLPQTIVVSIAFNTTSYGANPYGPNTTCAMNGNCPYDSLNVQLLQPYPTPPSWQPTITGSVWDPNGVFLNAANSYPACNDPNFPLNVLALDDNSQTAGPSGTCWPLPYHPQMEVTTF